MGARAGKYELAARVGKYKFGARAGKHKFGAGAGGQGQNREPSKGPGAGKYKYPHHGTFSVLEIKRSKILQK